MKRLIVTPALLLLTSYTWLTAYAGAVHKWVDADGVTHYSDTAPDSPATQVSMIDIAESNSVKTNVDNDYYSIKNQWQRLHKERLEQQKLALEKERQKAALQTTTPEVVYVSESNENRYALAYLGSFHHGYRQRRLHKRHERHHGFTSKRHYRNGKTPPGLHLGRLKLGSYKLPQ